MANKNLEKLLNKQMGRREFLFHIGAGALTIIGVSGLLKSLADYRPHRSVAVGYGNSTYGSKKK